VANYNTIDFNLGAAITPPRVVQATVGKEVESVTVLALPPGQVAFLRFGAIDKDPIRLVAGYQMSPCPPERDGVFLEIPAGGAGTLSLHFSFADAALPVEGA